MILKLGRSPCSACDQSPDWDGMGNLVVLLLRNVRL